MSVKIMGAIWDLDLPHELAWTLMAYADHADHDGRNCYPGTKLIAYKTGYSVRQVQRCTADLLARGLLIVERQGGGRGHATVYRIELSSAPQKAKTEAATVKGDNLSPFTEIPERVTPEPERVTENAETMTENAETMTKTGLKGDIAMSPQPLTVKPLTVKEPSGPARARESEELLAFYQKAGSTLERLSNRSQLRPQIWRQNGDGALECGIWEPEVFSDTQRQPVKYSTITQIASRHFGRRVTIRFVPAWGTDVVAGG